MEERNAAQAAETARMRILSDPELVRGSRNPIEKFVCQTARTDRVLRRTPAWMPGLVVRTAQIVVLVYARQTLAAMHRRSHTEVEFEVDNSGVDLALLGHRSKGEDLHDCRNVEAYTLIGDTTDMGAAVLCAAE